MSSAKDVADLVDAVRKFVSRLNDEAQLGAIVVVEGVRDVKALRSIGHSGIIYPLCHGGSLKQLVSIAEQHNKAILIFDLDTEGRALTKKAATLLQEKKIIIDLVSRKEFAHLTRGKFRNVEQLKSLKELFDLNSLM